MAVRPSVGVEGTFLLISWEPLN